MVMESVGGDQVVMESQEDQMVMELVGEDHHQELIRGIGLTRILNLRPSRAGLVTADGVPCSFPTKTRI